MHVFRARSGLQLEDLGVVVLQGGKTPHLYNCDNEPLFRWGRPLAAWALWVKENWSLLMK